MLADLRGHTGAIRPGHLLALRAGVVLILPTLLGQDAEVHLFPLPLARSDGAPVRAVARLWQSGAHAERTG